MDISSPWGFIFYCYHLKLCLMITMTSKFLDLNVTRCCWFSVTLWLPDNSVMTSLLAELWVKMNISLPKAALHPQAMYKKKLEWSHVFKWIRFNWQHGYQNGVNMMLKMILLFKRTPSVKDGMMNHGTSTALVFATEKAAYNSFSLLHGWEQLV